MDYFRLRDEIGDVFRENSAIAQAGVKWQFQNLLPNELELYIQPQFSKMTTRLATIGPRQTMFFDAGDFNGGDELYTYIKHNGKLFPFLEPYTLRAFFKKVHIGAVSYGIGEGHGLVQASYWDLRGVWIHNKTGFPLDVYYKGNLVAQTYANDGMNYMGGSAASVYFTNDRQGLNFGDELTFRYSLPGKKGEYIFNAVIDDEQCQEIYVGTVTGDYWGPDPDNSVYRVNKPTYTSVTYFIPDGPYSTRMTNPTAPYGW